MFQSFSHNVPMMFPYLPMMFSWCSHHVPIIVPWCKASFSPHDPVISLFPWLKASSYGKTPKWRWKPPCSVDISHVDIDGPWWSCSFFKCLAASGLMERTWPSGTGCVCRTVHPSESLIHVDAIFLTGWSIEGLRGCLQPDLSTYLTNLQADLSLRS